ncbi:hypothetical protein BaRGS_00031178 [Batillaria attramentaria]|uniref:BHLH domain-containing protein n=1 Tax=Batillaria attramentaria TaxID=370345 RepID=A0ABD0JRY3_9CAEN
MNRGRRHGTSGKRGQVPMRVRRRQSDAKWRASVASCYETLKLIIPNGKALPKRKASKALILQETERHIEELERGIARMLNVEAPERQKGVLWRNADDWTPATLDNFRRDFSLKQSCIFQQSTQGKRCYNLLHDIQEEILSLSADPESLAFVPVVPAEGTHTTKDVATCTNKRYRSSKSRCRFETERACQKLLSHFKSGEVVEAVIPTARKRQFELGNAVSEPLQAVPSLGLNPAPAAVATVQEADRTVPATPNKVYGIAGNDVMISQELEVADTFNSVMPGYSTSGRSMSMIKREVSDVPRSPTLSTVCKQLDFNTSPPDVLFARYENSHDNRLSIDTSVTTATSTGFTPLPTINSSGISGFGFTPGKFETGTTGQNVGFTPVKLPSDPYVSDSQLFSPNSAWALGAAMDARVPQAGLSDLEDLDMEENRSLLCMENFDLDDTADGPDALRTPQKQSIPTPSKVSHKQVVCKRKSRSSSTDGIHRHMPDRPRPKCRKRLEGLYDKPPPSLEKSSSSVVPVIAGIFDASAECSDFDGYLFYYRQVAPGIKKQLGGSPDANSVAAMVSDMWQRLPNDDRSTLVTLAALENHDSNSSENGSLSQDLEELDVKPLSEGFQNGVVS